MDVTLDDGTQLHEDTAIVLGHAENPMSEADFRGKFDGLVVPVLGDAETARLYESLSEFSRAGSFAIVMALLERDPRKH
jgi:2-methylcitrate dehydratase PrpD